MRPLLVLCLVTLASWLPAAEGAGSHGLSRLAVHEHPGASQAILEQADFETLAGADVIRGGRQGGEVWRLDLPAAEAPRLLVLHAPHGAVVTLFRPGRVAERQSIFDSHLDPRWSRRALVFPLDAEAGVVHLHVDRRGDWAMPLRVVDEADYVREDMGYLRVVASVQAAVATLFIVVLGFGLVLRERVYLLFAAYTGFQLLHTMTLTGEAFVVPGLRWLANMGTPAVWLITVLSLVFSLLFLREFARLTVHVPRLARAVEWMAVATLGLVVVVLTPIDALRAWVPLIGNPVVIAANVVLLVALLAAWWRGSRQAAIALLAWMPPLLANSAWYGMIATDSVAGQGLEYVRHAATVYLALTFTFALALRMRRLSRERDDAHVRAELDPLTGVYNRAGVQRELDLAMAEAEGKQRDLSVVYLDLDHFKRVNDRFGHPFGDACLRALVMVVAGELRQGDVIGRIGGEEFVVILRGAGAHHAELIAECIRRAVEQRMVLVQGRPVGLTVSVGATQYCPGLDTAESVLARADAGLYSAKRGGRNRVVPVARVVPDPT